MAYSIIKSLDMGQKYRYNVITYGVDNYMNKIRRQTNE